MNGIVTSVPRHGYISSSRSSGRWRRSTATLAPLILAWALAGIAGALPASAADVATEAALRSAFADAAETHIVLTADITLSDCGSGDLDRSAGTALVLEGSGEQRTITQTCPGERVLEQQGAGTLTLRAVRLRGGDVAGRGGGILAEGAVTLEDSVVEENLAQDGGGIAGGGDVTLLRSTVRTNTAIGAAVGTMRDSTGGVSTEGALTATDSTISGNSGHGGNGSTSSAGHGVGAVRSRTVVSLTRSEVSANTGTGGNGSSSSSGLGVGAVWTTTLELVDTTVHGNHAFGGSGSVSGASGIGSGGSAVGAALTLNGAATVSGSVIRDNSATGGMGTSPDGIGGGGFAAGALWLHGFESHTSTFEDSQVRGNTAVGGDGTAGKGIGGGGQAIGGIVTQHHLVMRRSTVAENEATSGDGSSTTVNGCCAGGGNATGGLRTETLTLVDSAVEGNVAQGGEDGNGGAGNDGGSAVGGIEISTFGRTSSMRDSTVSGNTGSGGAGLETAGLGVGALWANTEVAVVSSTVSGNTGTAVDATAPGTGGLRATTLELVHATVLGNGGSSQGNVATTTSGIPGAVRGVSAFGTVVAMPAAGPNCGDLGPDPLTSVGYNADDDGTCGFGAGPGDVSDAATPLGLADLADNGGPTATHLPALDSLLVDAIPVEACDGGDALAGAPVTTDQRGVARPQQAGCDIGAVEVEPPPPPPPPLPAREVRRLSGPERTATAAAISAASFPTADTVFLATAFNFPDALAGGPLAARTPGPILLTGSSSLAAAARGELERLTPATLVVLGGTGALSDAVVAEAAAAAGGAAIDRLSGRDRFGTAAAIAGRYPAASRVYLATGLNFPDALTGAALAAARDDGPVLLTLRDTLPAATAAELTRLAPAELVVLGGTGVVSDAIAEQAAAAAGGATIRRLSGTERFATGAAVAAEFPAPTDIAYIATGFNFPDALTGTPAAALTSSPIMLTGRDAIPAPTATQLDRLTPIQIRILGGAGVISAQVADQLAAHLR